MTCPYCKKNFPGSFFNHHLDLCAVRKCLIDVGLIPIVQDLEEDFLRQIDNLGNHQSKAGSSLSGTGGGDNALDVKKKKL
jgi:hypothetical protein